MLKWQIFRLDCKWINVLNWNDQRYQIIPTFRTKNQTVPTLRVRIWYNWCPNCAVRNNSHVTINGPGKSKWSKADGRSLVLFQRSGTKVQSEVALAQVQSECSTNLSTIWAPSHVDFFVMIRRSFFFVIFWFWGQSQKSSRANESWKWDHFCRTLYIPSPREATSVATNIGVRPSRNERNTWSRSLWLLSPWIALKMM